MGAPRQGLFIRADYRPGRIHVSAALLDALGSPRVAVVVDDSEVSLEPAQDGAINSRSLHRVGPKSNKGFTHNALWRRLPDGRVSVVSIDDGRRFQLFSNSAT